MIQMYGEDSVPEHGKVESSDRWKGRECWEQVRQNETTLPGNLSDLFKFSFFLKMILA